MKKILSLLTICMLLLGMAVVPASAADVFTPIVLDFDDYSSSTQTVNEYITAKGWDSSSTIDTISGGKGILNGTTLFDTWSDTNAPFDNTKSGYEFVVEFDAALTSYASGAGENGITGYYFPEINGNTSTAAHRILNGRLREHGTPSVIKYHIKSGNVETTDAFQTAITNKQELTYTSVVKFDSVANPDTGSIVSAYISDGNNEMLANDKNVNKNGDTSQTAIRRVHLGTVSGNIATVDNIRIYAANDVFALAGANVADNATNVALNQSLTYTFNNPILPFTLSGIEVTADGSTVNSSSYTVNLKKDSTGLKRIVEISFPAGMTAGAEYAVTFPTTLQDATRTALASPVTKSFTTVALPDFELALTATCGENSVTSLTGLAGKRIVCNAVATNQEAEAVSAMIMVGLYDENGALVQLGGLTKEVSASASASATYSLQLPDDVTGYSVKAVVCANVLNLTPYAETTLGAE